MKTLIYLLALVPAISWAAIGPTCMGVPKQFLAPFLLVYEVVQNNDPQTIEFFTTGRVVNAGLFLRLGPVYMDYRNGSWQELEATQATGGPYYVGIQGPSPNWFVLDTTSYADWATVNEEIRKGVCNLVP